MVIVPDRSLHAINFETLPVPGAKRHYFIEDVELQTAPSLSLLSVAPAAPRRAPTLLLMGDPAPRAPEFPALKYASAEIDSVSKYFPADGVTAYKAERASPAAYRTATPERFSYVHFTAHAAANLQSPLDSAVILSGTDDAYKLYARDVAQVPLRAELVTVSACRSAGERSYSGEGLIGFSWAFLRAGASRVIAGLWDVDDRSTVQLMDDLYAKIAAGDTAAHALREAKLALIAKGGNYAKPDLLGPLPGFHPRPLSTSVSGLSRTSRGPPEGGHYIDLKAARCTRRRRGLKRISPSVHQLTLAVARTSRHELFATTQPK